MSKILDTPGTGCAGDSAMRIHNLNKVLSERLNIQPRKITWEVFSPDEGSTCYGSEYKHEAERWLADTISQFPKTWVKDYHVGKLDHWHRLADSWDGMGVLIEALENHGYSWWLESATNWPATATVGESKVTADKAPMAVALAAFRALEAEGPTLGSEQNPLPEVL